MTLNKKRLKKLKKYYDNTYSISLIKKCHGALKKGKKNKKEKRSNRLLKQLKF